MIALFDGSCENNSTTCQRRGLNSFIFVMTAVKVLLKSLCEMHCLRSVFEQIVTGESCALVVRLVSTNKTTQWDSVLMSGLRQQLVTQVEKAWHTNQVLWSNACRLMLLKAFEKSTRRTASTSSFLTSEDSSHCVYCSFTTSFLS